MTAADAFGTGADDSIAAGPDPALSIDAAAVPGDQGRGLTADAGPDPEARALRRVLTLMGAVVLGLAGVIVLVSVVIGLGWGWTGFPSNGQLWDWLHLLLLPLALTLLPVWWKTQEGFRREWTLALGAVGVVFVVLLLGGTGGAGPGPGSGATRCGTGSNCSCCRCRRPWCPSPWRSVG